MKVWLAVILAAGIGACAHDPHKPQTVTELHQWHDWQHERGEDLYAALANDVSRIARREGRAGAIAQLGEAGYDCQYGEAHADYPEPMAVCTRSFATRACQFDWDVSLTSVPARPDGVETTDVDFRRDCVGTGGDWPEPVVSAIDDQLAPSALLPGAED
ncbi:MAG: hypothetical protein ACK4P2_03925 [Hyphomonas sp.]